MAKVRVRSRDIGGTVVALPRKEPEQPVEPLATANDIVRLSALIEALHSTTPSVSLTETEKRLAENTQAIAALKQHFKAEQKPVVSPTYEFEIVRDINNRVTKVIGRPV